MRRRWKALLTADLHLGDKMYQLREREQDVYDACKQVMQIAKSSGVDIVIVAGDAFDTGRPQASAVAALKNAVDEFGGPVFGIEGNHDRVGTGEWLSVCGVTPLSMREYDPDLGVYGIDHERPSDLMARLEELATMCEENEQTIPLLVLHCGFLELGDPFAAEVTFDNVMPYLKRMGTKTVCVGHIHKHQVAVYTKDGYSVTFIQPGSIEVGSVNEEKEKVVYLVEFGNDGITACSAARLSTRPFKEYRLDSADDYASFVDGIEKDAEAKNALNIIRYRSTVNEISNGIDALMRRLGLLYKKLPYCEELAVEEVERDHQLISLESIVADYYEKGGDVYELLMLMLNNPEKTAEKAEQYILGKDYKN